MGIVKHKVRIGGFCGEFAWDADTFDDAEASRGGALPATTTTLESPPAAGMRALDEGVDMSETTFTTPTAVTHKPQAAAVVRGVVPVDEMVQFLDSAFTVLRAAVDAAAIAPTGPMYSRYDSELEGDVTIEAGVPILAELDAPVEFNGVAIEPGDLPGGEVMISLHTGPYSELRGVWQDFLGGIGRAGRTPAKPYIEQYLVAPSAQTDPSQLRTELIAHLEG